MFVDAWQDGRMASALTLTDVSRPEAASQACCAPLVREAADPQAAAELAHVFKALSDPTRIRLLSVIAAHEGGEACVCDLTAPVGLSQPTVSHHLKLLVDAGLLTREQRGKWAYYSVVPGALNRLGMLLTDATS